MRTVSFCAIIVEVSIFCANLEAMPQRIYVMRHAEKPHPEIAHGPLSQVGRVRAAKLADFPLHPRPTVIFYDTTRTHQTITPLAATLGITPKLFPLDQTAQMAEEAKTLPSSTVLLACLEHNHIPSFVKTLTGLQLKPWGANVFDRVLVLSLQDKRWNLEDVQQGQITEHMQRHAQSVEQFQKNFRAELVQTQSDAGRNTPHLTMLDLCLLTQEHPEKPYYYAVDGSSACSERPLED